MIAYNRAWLDALLIKATAQEWGAKGLLNAESGQAIQAAYPSNFYTPNLFVRIGLGIFCSILLSSVMGFGSLFMMPDEQIGFGLLGLFWGIVWIIVLDFWMIRSARHFRSGIDDVLLYTGISLLLFGFCALLPDNADTLAYSWVALPFLVFGSIRYLDRLLTAASFFCALTIVVLTVNTYLPGLALYILPFVGMAFAAGAYFFARYGQRRYDWRHWYECLVVVEVLALIIFYTSGNYWIIQQTGAEVFQLEQVPMGWLFWTFTFLIPVFYVVQGLRKKDRLLLDLGMASIGAAVFTFRYYFHVLPLTWAAVLVGAVLFITAYFSIRYLKAHEGAYTYEADADTSFLQEVEEQLIEQTIASQSAPTPVQRDDFGGGQFGGSGGGGEF